MFVILQATMSLQSTAVGQTIPQSEGAQRYAPSRLEWLAVELNSEMGVSLIDGHNYSIQFVALDSQNTLLIAVFYLPNVSREEMNLTLDNARKLTEMKAKYYGWTSWLKIREDVKLTKLR